MGPAAEVPELPLFKNSLGGECIILDYFSGSSLSMSWVKSGKSVKIVLC